jgi:Fe-S-cluster containining protein
METKEIRRIFYRDGYRLAHEHLEQGLNALNLRSAIAQLYQAVDDLLASFLERSATDGEPSECKKGCAWCCYQEVFAVTHEFLYIHEYVQENFSQEVKDSILKRARDKGKLSLNKSLEEQMKLRFACPFLEGDSCLVYKARPMACRVYLSSSVRSCKREFDQPGNQKNIPELYEFPLLAGRMLNEGFVAYLKQSGLLSSELPIELGYSSLLTFGQTMEEWVEGRPGSS